MSRRKRCTATIEFGDDHGDNTATFHCKLMAGHVILHEEDGEMTFGQKYMLKWVGDAKTLERWATLKKWLRRPDWWLAYRWHWLTDRSLTKLRQRLCRHEHRRERPEPARPAVVFWDCPRCYKYGSEQAGYEER